MYYFKGYTLAEILWLKLVVSRAIVKKDDELRVFVGYLSDTRSERPIHMIIDNHTQRATTRECKPMSHHERTILHRTRRAQGHSCHIAIIRHTPSCKASIGLPNSLAVRQSAPSYGIKRHQEPPLV